MAFLSLPLLAALDPADAHTATVPTALAGDAEPTEVRYGRDIRPLLSDRCFQCHGADAAARQAGLRLDEFASATLDRGGFAPLIPGDAQSSDVWQRITSDYPDEMMPPPSAKKPRLNAEEQRLIERWINAGAIYEPHWSFVAPQRPAVPTPTDVTWLRNPIDAFVARKLEREGISPSAEADPETLLRRLYLDSTGLPPTVEELDAFLDEPDPSMAYERAVERIFTEEPYKSRIAERLATPWLDSARYGDTIGIHTDSGRQMWLWRDWVLAAFRDNMPYDQFVIEQLAGDLLPDATTAQKIASGFNRNHVMTDEGGAISEEYLIEYAVDRVSTTSAVFLGLTAACARCHDHKFDPITQADFYGLLAYFNSNDEPGLYTQIPDPNRAFEPFIEVPTSEQSAKVSQLEKNLAEVVQRMNEPLHDEQEIRENFIGDQLEKAGIHWSQPTLLDARSSDKRVSLDLQQDGSVQASGPHPDAEDFILSLQSEAANQRLLLIEALPNPENGQGVGRADHANAVLSGVKLEARPVAEVAEWSEVSIHWAWADHSQQNEDFEVTNALTPDARGWAADGPQVGNKRNLVFLSEEPFGYEGGTELRVTLSFRSRYSAHSMGRVRVHVSPLIDTSVLPASLGRWYSAGPFSGPDKSDRQSSYDTAFGPELFPDIDLERRFGKAEKRWAFDSKLQDDAVVGLSSEAEAIYIGRDIWSPDERTLDLSLGSDDGFRLFLNGAPVAELRVDRGAAPDQDTAQLALRPGINSLVLKIVNTGGPGSYYFRAVHAPEVLVGKLPGVLLPAGALGSAQSAALTESWRRAHFDAYRELDDRRALLEEEVAAIRATFPLTMVMREREEPRETYVLMRGEYDKPDKSRPTPRAVPAFLPPLPSDAPPNRLGFSRWLVAAENPLFARVAVNRFWQLLFGTGIVATAQDFGLQGDWPSHPELLDWLAVEFRESDWDVHGLLRTILLSSTYRQASTVREDVAERDPGNRWLSFYPRRRLSAEQLRDQALYTSGLLVEQFGGPPVKPYQPKGLWSEVSMLASNTRDFELGVGQELWRRSLYTYWKRAVPPPALQTLDAPNRESCVVRRQPTNTPLQALVLWNDEQFVEAARNLAATVLDVRSDDRARVVVLMRSCTGRSPSETEIDWILEALDYYRQRFGETPADAEELAQVGQAPVPMNVDAAELGAWTLIASSVLNLHETLTQR